MLVKQASERDLLDLAHELEGRDAAADNWPVASPPATAPAAELP